MIDTIVLDDNIEYVIMDTLTINNTEYTIFSNIDNEEDICLRKTKEENGKKFYVGLEDKKECELVITTYINNLK